MELITNKLEIKGNVDEQEKRISINHSLEKMAELGKNTDDEVRNYLLRCVHPEDEYFTGIKLTYDEALNFYNELKGIKYDKPLNNSRTKVR